MIHTKPILGQKIISNMESPRLMFSTSNGMHLLSPDEIIRLEASSNYTFIHFTNKSKILSAKVLKDFAHLLEPLGFIRTHRTHLVNRNYISRVCKDGKIIMQDTSVAEVSRRKRVGLIRMLKNAC